MAMTEDAAQKLAREIMGAFMGPAVKAIENELLDAVPLTVLTTVLGYLDSADELGTETTTKERMLLDLLDRMENDEVELLALTRVLWISQLAAVYLIATDSGLQDGTGRDRVRSRVRVAHGWDAAREAFTAGDGA